MIHCPVFFYVQENPYHRLNPVVLLVGQNGHQLPTFSSTLFMSPPPRLSWLVHAGDELVAVAVVQVPRGVVRTLVDGWFGGLCCGG